MDEVEDDREQTEDNAETLPAALLPIPPGRKRKRVLKDVPPDVSSPLRSVLTTSSHGTHPRTACSGASSAEEPKTKLLVNQLTLSSRSFALEARVTFRSAAERSKKGQLKMDMTLMDSDQNSIDMFILGDTSVSVMQSYKYDDLIMITNPKVQAWEGKLRLVAYPSTPITVCKATCDASQFPEDNIEVCSIRAAMELPNTSKTDLLVYVIEIFPLSTRPMGDRDVPSQEVLVRDETSISTVVELMDVMAGKAGTGFFLIKRAEVWNSRLQIWGRAMMTDAPVDMNFDITGPVTEV